MAIAEHRGFSRGGRPGSRVERVINGGLLQGVYFVRCNDFIKIGVAVNVYRRVEGLAGANPYKLEPLGWINERIEEEAFIRERELHRRFAEHRHRGEWFHAHQDILTFIAEHARPWPTRDNAGIHP